MKALLRSARWLLLAGVISLIPLSSRAEVFISVAIAPPALLTYDQPPCPEPGWMWTPGYWAYDYVYGDYYWVPGTWVPAPYEGALWTPGYWGFETGVYLWHPGYWGRHVGYYGGVNYGFGFFGIGFMGGEWRGNRFAYNTAVWHVDRNRIRDVYEDRRDLNRHYVDRDRHIAYEGGPNGIRHDPTPQERQWNHEQRMQPTNSQQQHMRAAERDRDLHFNNNHGRPPMVVAQRPITAPPAGHELRPNGGNNGGRPNGYQQNRNGGQNPMYDQRNQMGRPNSAPQNQHPVPQNQPNTRPQYGNQQQNQLNARPQPDNRNRQPDRQTPGQIRPQDNPAPPPQQQMRPQPQPQQRPEPQARPEPQQRPAPPPQQQMRPQPQPQQRPEPQARPEPLRRQVPPPQQMRPQPQPEQRPQPQARPQQESHPAPAREDHGDGHDHR